MPSVWRMETRTDSQLSPSNPLDPFDPSDPSDPEDHPHAAFAAIGCADGKSRCPWAVATPGALIDHDHEWAVTPRTATEYFQALSIELFDSGLARWSQSGRHPSWYLYMADLEPAKVARLDVDDVEDLLLNPELIRNRAKIEAVIHNAQVCEDWVIADWVELLTEAQVPPPTGPPLRSLDLPDSTPDSRRLSGLFRERGFKLIGPVTAHRWLQRTALAPGHVQGCFRAEQTGPVP